MSVPAQMGTATPARSIQLHPLSRRVMHWINALAIIVMIGSGWRIYNYYPALSLHFAFPYDWTLGGDFTVTEAASNEDGLANALLWHFAAMWVLVLNFLAYVIVGVVSGHFRRDFLPISVAAFARDFFAALRGRLGHQLGEYNAVQKVFYWGVLAAIVVTILSGLGIWKPVQLQWLTLLFGGYEFARVVHFFGMAAIVAFLIVHLALTALVPKTLVAMLAGRASDAPPDGRTAMSDFVLKPKPVVTAIERRLFLRQTLSLGALTLLTGCDISDHNSVQNILRVMSRWNDRAQAFLFSRQTLAPTYAESDVVRDFRYNAFFPAADAPTLSAADYRLELSGLIAAKRPWSVDQIYALPQQSQITRHVCVEGWSMIGKWSGPQLGDFLNRVGADLSAKYVGFECADGYYGSIDMPSALHPQTIMAVKFADQLLPAKYGYPFKVRIPTKLGFKNPKWVTTIFVTNRYPGGFWEDRGYNWFSGS